MTPSGSDIHHALKLNNLKLNEDCRERVEQDAMIRGVSQDDIDGLRPQSEDGELNWEKPPGQCQWD